MAETWAVIVAAGDGRRFGRQKQFVPLAGRSVLEWSLAAAGSVADGIVLVLPADRVEEGGGLPGVDVAVAGGATRSASVRAGIAAVPGSAEVIVVHDAARPLATPSLFQAVVAALGDDVEGAIPGVALSDTIKRVRDGEVESTLDRSELVAVQTPQAFLARVLRSAHADEPDATDDAALLERLGCRVAVVPGETSNRKLTEAEDLAQLERLLAERLRTEDVG